MGSDTSGNSSNTVPLLDANLIYESASRSILSCSFKYKAQLFEMNRLLRTAEIQRDLANRSYRPQKGFSFTIRERGKTRKITSDTMIDKTVNHLICDHSLSPELDRFVSFDNMASQKGKGTDKYRSRLKAHLQQYYREQKTHKGYILLIDFSKYYDRINHEKAKKQLMALLKKTNSPNLELNEFIFDETFKIFASEGINIGNQISQNIGVLYSMEIDNLIKIKYGFKYWGRYMDDSYVISNSKERLEELLEAIKVKAKEWDIVINEKKTRIQRLDIPFKHLQLKYYFSETGKIRVSVSPAAITRERRKLKAYKRFLDSGKMPIKDIEDSFKSWFNSRWRILSPRQIKHITGLYKELFGELPQKWYLPSRARYYVFKGKTD